jgi:integrase/recombinase XerC
MLASSLRLDTALSEYQITYLPSRNLAPRSRAEYVADIADLIRFLTAAQIHAADAVSANHLQDYLAELDRRGLAGSTRQRKTFAIRSFFRFLEATHEVRPNPAATLVPPAVERPQPRVLTEAEYKRLQLTVAQSTDFAAVRDAAIIEVLLQTGMRLTELANLLLNDVVLPERIKPDGEPGAVRVWGKGRKERVCTLNWKGCNAVLKYKKQRSASSDPHLFLSKRRTGLRPRAIQVLVEKRLKEARIEGATVHTLRHTFGTHQVRLGTKLPIVRDMMGHGSISTTEKYVHLAREEQQKQLQQNAL